MKKTTAGKKTPAKPIEKKEPAPLYPVEQLAKSCGLPDWETAALTVAAGWAKGKQVSEKQFQTALSTFHNRPQGGGRIQV
ncbi:MAG: hypothetical protein MI862_26675 [Desulfobacterales bacterium]|nr:hypothetical protein [Desulfobacterales bacterium]